MTDFYVNECHFNGGATSLNATNGWDAVYAIKFDAINADIVLRQPWTAVSSSAQWDGSTSQITGPTLTSLTLVVGDSAPNTDWELGGTASYQDGTGSYTAAFVASFSAALTFSADPANAGINHLKVDAGTVSLTDLSVGAVTLDGSNGATTVTLAADAVSGLQTVVEEGVMSSAGTLFGNSLALVMDNDYAKSVNVPWLAPTYFTYALGVMPNDSTEGLLAVLSTSKTGTALQALTASFNANLFPIDDDINAAVFISPTVVGKETFGELLNQRAASSVIGKLNSDPATGSVSNASDVALLFKYNENTGEGAFISTTGGADFEGTSHSATIPAGQLVFAIGSDAITVNVNKLSVSLGGGMSLDIVMDMSFALVINSTSNEIDVALNGEPTITTHFNNAEASGWETFTNIASVLVSTFASEAAAFAIDRISSSLTTTPDAKVRQYQHDFFAAAAQSEKEGKPVSFSIGWDKEMIVHYLDERVPANHEEPPVKLSSAFKSQLELKSELALDIGADAAGARGTQTQSAIELMQTNQTLLHDITDIQVHPLDALDPLVIAPPASRRRIVRTGAAAGGLARQLREMGGGRIVNVDRGGNIADPPHQDPIVVPRRLDPEALAQRLQPIAAAQDREAAELAARQRVATQRASRGVVNRFCESVITRIGVIAQERKDGSQSALKTQSYGDLLQQFAESKRSLSSIETLSVKECKELYASCAKFMNDGYAKGWIDATGYLETVRQYNVLAAGSGNAETAGPVIGSVRPPDRAAAGDTYRADVGHGGADGHDREPLLPENRYDGRSDVALGTSPRYKITTRTTFMGSGSVFSTTRQVRQGLLDEIALTTNGNFGNRFRGSPTATAALVGDIIRDTKRPAWAWFWGMGWYVGGLAAGYFGGNAIAQGISNLAFDGGKNARENAAGAMASVQSTLNTNPASLLFSSVTFPLMTSYSDDASGTLPQPATVLKRASVNGALVLGAEISLYLS